MKKLKKKKLNLAKLDIARLNMLNHIAGGTVSANSQSTEPGCPGFTLDPTCNTDTDSQNSSLQCQLGSSLICTNG